jgi:hypothetical protein
VVQEYAGGDPMTSRRWVRRSLRNLSADLKSRGHRACPNTVRRLLGKQHISLRSNIKRLAGPPHPDREIQFQHIARQRRAFEKRDLPVLSIDAKKKELIGNFKNPGRAWRQEPESVNVYDFIHDAQCRATPYGIYDTRANRGHVCVGTSADTAAFAVDALADWWRQRGKARYPQAKKLLLLSDGGGSNGCRPRLWKRSLQQWCDRSGLSVTVCHYPTGASKWNPVEHRLFSPISLNWVATPLRTLGTMLACLRGTKTRSGLRVTAQLNDRTYPRKVKVTNQEMSSLNLQRHETCPQWNYTIRPRPCAPRPRAP